MIKRLIHCAISLIGALCLSASLAQAQTESGHSEQGNKSVTYAGGSRKNISQTTGDESKESEATAESRMPVE